MVDAARVTLVCPSSPPEGSGPDEVDLLLNCLLAHRLEILREFLRQRQLPVSGTRSDLRERIAGGLASGQLDRDELINLLDAIEGWGDQHIFLYRSTDAAVDRWRTESTARSLLAGRGLGGFFNKRRPLLLPERPTLSSVEWNKSRVRFFWVERREWEERVHEDDKESQDTVWRAYRHRTDRGVTTFDWDLVSGHAALMIEQLPSGTRYDRIRLFFELELEPLIGVSGFTPVRVSRAIGSIERSGEARCRQLVNETRRGGKVSFTSAHRSKGVFVDADLQNARAALGGREVGSLGNFYWQPVVGKLARETHMKIYAADQRVGIFGERSEGEVRYLLSRLRHHSL